MNVRTADAVDRVARDSGGPRGWVRSAWHAVTGVIATIVGLAPHVLHHVGFLAGSALVAGATGTAVFGAVGLLAATPMLIRLYRRFRTWRAPAIAVAVFAVMFSLSAFVIGPAISGSSDEGSPDAPASQLDEHGH
jgi:hypothetical protein